MPKHIFKSKVEKDARAEELRKLNEALNSSRTKIIGMAEDHSIPASESKIENKT